MPYWKPNPWGTQKPPAGASLDGKNFISKDLVGRFLFNEGGGNVLQDIARENTGVWNGTPPHYGPGIFGTSGSLNGANYANCGADSSLTDLINGPFTFSAWIYVFNSGVSMTIASKANNSVSLATGGWALQAFGGSPATITFSMFTSLTNRTSVVSNVALGIWNHIVVINYGNNLIQYPTIYFNGLLQSLTNTAGTGTVASDSTFNLVLGADSTGANNFQSKMDNIGIWTRSLTDSESQRLYVEPFAGISFSAASLRNSPAAVGRLFLQTPMNGIAVGGPFYAHPIG